MSRSELGFVMSEQNGNLEGWSDAVSAASRHLQEREVAEEEAAERAKPKRNAAWVVVALVVLVAVLVGDVWVLTRIPDPPPAKQQEADLHWLVADVVEAVEDFRSAEGRLPAPSDLDLPEGDIVYELRDGGYVVLAEGDGVHLEFDGNVPLAEWVAPGGSEADPETTP